MNGCQFAGFIAFMAPAMNSKTTATLITTMTLLNEADSLMPTMSKAVTAAIMKMAGTLKRAVTVEPSASVTRVPRAAENCGGKMIPKSFKSETTYPDQPIATVTAPSAYSRIRSQPIIHATNSPRVAYPYV